MTTYPLDIIVPIWNRPVEVRAALAAFVAATPDARIVMVNNGSERETESILDEFAEALDDRALLVATNRNIGSIAALNLGISKATAPLVLVTTPFARVEPGWFDGAVDHFARNTTTGALTLRKGGKYSNDPIETDHGSFDAMIVRRSLYDTVGGFDEELDGGEWALRDFARRSLAAGYRSFSLSSRFITLNDHTELGSATRREERVRLAREAYVSRWGSAETFLVFCQEPLFGLTVEALKDALLQSARQGDSITLIAERRTAAILLQSGFSAAHENISFQSLPRFFSNKTLGKVIERVATISPSAAIIAETEIDGSGLNVLPFSDFLAILAKRSELYRLKGDS